MPKRIVEDVVPPSRRSIRNIPLPSSKQEMSDPVPQPSFPPQQSEVIPPTRKSPPIQPKKVIAPPKPSSKPVKKRKSRFMIGLIVLVCVLILGVGLSYVFANATVTVTPRTQALPINISVTASNEPGTADLMYQTITLSKEKSLEVPATGEENVEQKASGSIIIYNNFNADPQVLVKNTRFRTPTGLIYRIQDQVSVPGKKGDTPGSLKVTIYADAAGEKYNIGLSDFVVPGFESDSARFKAITAKSDPTSPIQGGFVGMVKQVTDANKQTANQTLESGLRKEIEETIDAQIPDGYMSVDSGLTLTFENLPQTPGSTDGTATLTKKATAQALILDTAQLQDKVVSIAAGDEEAKAGIRIDNLNELPITIEKTPTTADPTIKLRIDGNVQLIWNIDQKTLSESLAGKSRKNLKPLLSPFTSIEKAEAVVRPFWSTTFPKSPEKVFIQVVTP